MNLFEKGLASCFSAEQLKRIQSVSVGIAGAGGLGSNCAVNLVRCGFRKFTIVDFDTIEPGNLNRQCYFIQQIGESKVTALETNLKMINPDISIQALQKKLDGKNMISTFSGCDIVVEAFDRPELKQLLIDSFIGSGIYIVAASGLGKTGETDDIRTQYKSDELCIVGDMKNEFSSQFPPLSPGVQISAAKEADAVLSYVLQGGPDNE